MDNLITITGTYKNKKLTTQFKAIANAYNTAQKGAEKVARALKEIKDNELWKDDFTKFEDSIAQFGLGKAQAYRVINAVNVKDEHEDLIDFTISQVSELARLDSEEIENALQEGYITKEMSCASIRKYVDSVKQALIEETAEEVEDAEEIEETAEEVEDDSTVTYTVKLGANEYNGVDFETMTKLAQILEEAGYTIK